MHVALIGGLGTGKTWASRSLCKLVEDTSYIYMSLYAVRIPMALCRTSHPKLLTYSRQEYINTVLSNTEIPGFHFDRSEMDAFGKKVFKRYGPAVVGEIALAVVPHGKTGVFDGIATVDNVVYMKSKGVYIVGLECKFKTQVERRLEDARDIDPKERLAMEKQIRDTQKLFETEKCLSLAHVVYDTDRMSELGVAYAVAPRIMAKPK